DEKGHPARLPRPRPDGHVGPGRVPPPLASQPASAGAAGRLRCTHGRDALHARAAGTNRMAPLELGATLVVQGAGPCTERVISSSPSSASRSLPPWRCPAVSASREPTSRGPTRRGPTRRG